jgi:hypothetical protein
VAEYSDGQLEKCTLYERFWISLLGSVQGNQPGNERESDEGNPCESDWKFFGIGHLVSVSGVKREGSNQQTQLTVSKERATTNSACTAISRTF